MKSRFLKDAVKLLPYGLTDKVNRSKFGSLSFLIVVLIGIITVLVWISNRISIGLDLY